MSQAAEYAGGTVLTLVEVVVVAVAVESKVLAALVLVLVLLSGRAVRRGVSIRSVVEMCADGDWYVIFGFLRIGSVAAAAAVFAVGGGVAGVRVEDSSLWLWLIAQERSNVTGEKDEYDIREGIQDEVQDFEGFAWKVSALTRTERKDFRLRLAAKKWKYARSCDTAVARGETLSDPRQWREEKSPPDTMDSDDGWESGSDDCRIKV
jgi:hypothetical protein